MGVGSIMATLIVSFSAVPKAGAAPGAQGFIKTSGGGVSRDMASGLRLADD